MIIILFDKILEIRIPFEVDVFELILIFERLDLFVLSLELESEKVIIFFKLFEQIILLTFSIILADYLIINNNTLDKS